jgi:stalled ribosome rescue protein Dom34
VAVTGKKEEVKEILSQVEKQPGRIEGARSTTPYEAQMVPADDSRQRGLSGHLDKYYDEVISHLRNADAILIFGPGEAKGELVKRIERDNLSERVARIETAGKMTVPQIAAEVRAIVRSIKVDSHAKINKHAA